MRARLPTMLRCMDILTERNYGRAWGPPLSASAAQLVQLMIGHGMREIEDSACAD